MCVYTWILLLLSLLSSSISSPSAQRPPYLIARTTQHACADRWRAYVVSRARVCAACATWAGTLSRLHTLKWPRDNEHSVINEMRVDWHLFSDPVLTALSCPSKGYGKLCCAAQRETQDVQFICTLSQYVYLLIIYHKQTTNDILMSTWARNETITLWYVLVF